MNVLSWLHQHVCAHRYRLRTRPNAANYGYSLWDICDRCGHIRDPFEALPRVKIGATITKRIESKHE